MNRTIVLLMASLVVATLVAGGTAVYALAGHGGGSVPSVTGCLLGTGKLVKFKVGDVPKQPCGGATEVHLSGGDITAVLPGFGLDPRSGATQGPATLGVDPTVIQNRVRQACGPDSAITQINQDGSVACGGGDITAVLPGYGLDPRSGANEGDATLGVDPTVVQNRVSKECGTDAAISQINEDGSIDCDKDDGFRNYVVVDEISAEDSVGVKSLTTECPVGTVVTGGGGDVDGERAFFTMSQPSSTGPGWRVTAKEVPPHDINWDLRVFAICADID